MKLDLDKLRVLGGTMKEAYQTDGDFCTQLDKGSHVYRISFEPSTGSVEAHIQWPMFRNLVANEADHPAVISKHSVDGDQSFLHCSCSSHGVEISTCLHKHEVVNMLKNLVAEHPESDYKVCENDDILILFIVWQNMTGWDLDWSEEVVTDGSN